MKKVFLFSFLFILLAFVFSSCKKDSPQTTAQKLQHTWSIITVTTNEHDGSDDIMTYKGEAGDFITFSSDGTLTSFSDGTSEKVPYVLTDDTHISIAGDTYTIQTLTNSILTLYFKQVISNTQFYEETINLKR